METPKNNPNYIAPIDIKNFQWSFKVSKEVFDILTFSEEAILWQQDDNRVILFTLEWWERFVESMIKKAWFSENKIRFWKEWSDFSRNLGSRAHPLQVVGKNKFKLPKLAYMRGVLEWKDFSIRFQV